MGFGAVHACCGEVIDIAVKHNPTRSVSLGHTQLQPARWSVMVPVQYKHWKSMSVSSQENTSISTPQTNLEPGEVVLCEQDEG